MNVVPTLDQYRAAETEPRPPGIVANARQMPGPVCWIVISAIPYHNARFSAFAAHESVPPVLLEITDHEPFSCLKVAPSATPYVRRLLCPGVKRNDMSPRVLRTLLFQTLD